MCTALAVQKHWEMKCSDKAPLAAADHSLEVPRPFLVPFPVCSLQLPGEHFFADWCSLELLIFLSGACFSSDWANSGFTPREVKIQGKQHHGVRWVQAFWRGRGEEPQQSAHYEGCWWFLWSGGTGKGWDKNIQFFYVFLNTMHYFYCLSAHETTPLHFLSPLNARGSLHWLLQSHF